MIYMFFKKLQERGHKQPGRTGLCTLGTVLLAGVLSVSPALAVSTAYGREGSWEQDKKRWRYMYGPDTPAEDEWIVEDGKEYYVDSKGYMKTGWFTDPSDGNKYYLGEDGAKCYNSFTKDDKYVGPEGTVVER